MILEEIQIILDEKSKPIDKYTKIPNQINQYSSNYIIKVAFEQEQTDILYIDAVFTIDGKAAIVKRLIPTTDKIQLSPSKESGIVRYYQFKQKDTSVYSDIFKIDFYVYYGTITDPTIAAFSYSIPMQKQNYMTLNESPDVIPQIVINSDTPAVDNLRAIELNGVNYDVTIKPATIDTLGGIKSAAPGTVGETYNVSVNEDGTAYVKVPNGRQGQPGNGLYCFDADLSLTPLTDASYPNETKYEITNLPEGVNWSYIGNPKAEIVAIKFLNSGIEYEGNLYILEINAFKDANRAEDYFNTNSFVCLYKVTIISEEPMQFTIEQVPAFININIQTEYGNKMYYNITANNQNAVSVLCSGYPEMSIFYTVPQEE